MSRKQDRFMPRRAWGRRKYDCARAWFQVMRELMLLVALTVALLSGNWESVVAVLSGGL